MQDSFSDDDEAPELELDEDGMPKGDVSLEALDAMSPEERAGYDMMISFDTDEGTWVLPVRLCLDENYQPTTPGKATILIVGHENCGWFELKFSPDGESGEDGVVSYERFTYH